MEDSFSNEACYIFVPPSSKAGARPTKRRKVSSSNFRTSETSLPSLFEGREGDDLAKRRYRTYHDLWSTQEHKLQEVLREANAQTIDQVCEFLNEEIENGDHDRIPVGFINAGLATSSSGSTLSSISERYTGDSQTLITSLSPSQCPNLKTALRNLLLIAADAGVDEDEDEATAKPIKGVRLLNYDLQILQDVVIQKTLSRVIIHFKDSEAFDGPVLSDLMDVLSCWLDRIPFVLVFEVATSVELFQEKLSRHALRLLRATVFEAKSSTEILDLLFRCATSPDETRFLWLGANASRLLLDRQTEHIQSARGFVTAMQYMYMLHFYNNPLSSLLCGVRQMSLSTEHVLAIRKLPSFKRYIDDLMDDEETEKAASLLEDDKYLLNNLEARLKETKESLDGMFYALEVLRIVYSLVPNKASLTWSTLYIKAMSGDLAESTAIRELSLSIKKLPSDTMMKLIKALSEIPSLDLQNASSKLERLTAKYPSSASFRTEYNASNSILQTTIVGQKVSLSKSKVALSTQDGAYSKIVNQIDLTLREFLTRNIVFPKELILHEILVFDSKASCRDVLGPLPRQAIERALHSPHDYLACECCGGAEGLKATQPATSIVYQLYLESGSLINVADLWAAFQAITTPERDEDTEESELLRTKNQALFFRALAELKYLGMMRSSRRKADHVTKILWKGL